MLESGRLAFGQLHEGGFHIHRLGLEHADAGSLFHQGVVQVLDGLSALRTIKSMHPRMEVAMVSSVSGDAQKAEEAFRLGACQVLGKPFDPEVIEALVESCRVAAAQRPMTDGEGAD